MNLFKINENDFNFILANAGRDILINNIPTKALITNTTIKENNNDKYISTLTEIKQGDRIEYNGLYWLVISDVNGKRYDKYKGVIRACNHNIGFKINNEPVCIPVIAYGSAIGVTTDKFISLPENKIILTMQNNDITSQIKINDTFVKWGRLYTVEGIDLTQPGLINLHCTFTSSSTDTEFVCTEAGDINYTPWYITITGETELEPDNTYSYTAKVYDSNGNEHNYLNVTWSVSDGANSTIDQNGNLTVSAEDENITIYATLEGTNITGELNIEIQSLEITYIITGANDIIINTTQTYTASKLINGIPDPNAKFSFSIDYQGNSSSVATLTIISDTECSIKCNDSVYYITLIAEDIDTGEIVKKENIKLRSLF
ncbi:Ig-like domain-containing protein [Desulfolucanica intricata]|uniref:Ig-like domain-containing protein n=1 Tax=Desulfolucanica intricata TaxID=1285191 RepID=UPI0008312854|nr:Ig-like domain-containing protein [Desulfolucanica intricata]